MAKEGHSSQAPGSGQGLPYVATTEGTRLTPSGKQGHLSTLRHGTLMPRAGPALRMREVTGAATAAGLDTHPPGCRRGQNDPWSRPKLPTHSRQKMQKFGPRECDCLQTPTWDQNPVPLLPSFLGLHEIYASQFIAKLCGHSNRLDYLIVGDTP
ncbi:uncharacterized protein LOC143685839 [Tamandua tetradactyla]|uniref:uncharacterized protein LOC143685839 n=1 Tax=Tamandua tetradactyla TaxID=48850 RepID=UPI0040545DCB